MKLNFFKKHKFIKKFECEKFLYRPFILNEISRKILIRTKPFILGTSHAAPPLTPQEKGAIRRNTDFLVPSNLNISTLHLLKTLLIFSYILSGILIATPFLLLPPHPVKYTFVCMYTRVCVKKLDMSEEYASSSRHIPKSCIRELRGSISEKRRPGSI